MSREFLGPSPEDLQLDKMPDQQNKRIPGERGGSSDGAPLIDRLANKKQAEMWEELPAKREGGEARIRRIEAAQRARHDIEQQADGKNVLTIVDFALSHRRLDSDAVVAKINAVFGLDAQDDLKEEHVKTISSAIDYLDKYQNRDAPGEAENIGALVQGLEQRIMGATTQTPGQEKIVGQNTTDNVRKIS